MKVTRFPVHLLALNPLSPAHGLPHSFQTQNTFANFPLGPDRFPSCAAAPSSGEGEKFSFEAVPVSIDAHDAFLGATGVNAQAPVLLLRCDRHVDTEGIDRKAEEDGAESLDSGKAPDWSTSGAKNNHWIART